VLVQLYIDQEEIKQIINSLANRSLDK